MHTNTSGTLIIESWFTFLKNTSILITQRLKCWMTSYEIKYQVSHCFESRKRQAATMQYFALMHTSNLFSWGKCKNIILWWLRVNTQLNTGYDSRCSTVPIVLMDFHLFILVFILFRGVGAYPSWFGVKGRLQFISQAQGTLKKYIYTHIDIVTERELNWTVVSVRQPFHHVWLPNCSRNEY